MDRVVIIGTSGSGKSTLARHLANQLGLPHTELDALAQGPRWQTVSQEELRRAVEEHVQAPQWVFDGNYVDGVARILWPRADTIIWLDLPLWVVLARLLRRSVRRILTRTELWNGNREGLSALIGRNSVLVWAVRSHRQYRAEFPRLLRELAGEGTTVIRLRSIAEIRAWMTTADPLTASPSTTRGRRLPKG